MISRWLAVMTTSAVAGVIVIEFNIIPATRIVAIAAPLGVMVGSNPMAADAAGRPVLEGGFPTLSAVAVGTSPLEMTPWGLVATGAVGRL